MISVNVKLYIVSNLTVMFACDYDFSERSTLYIVSNLTVMFACDYDFSER